MCQFFITSKSQKKKKKKWKGKRKIQQKSVDLVRMVHRFQDDSRLGNKPTFPRGQTTGIDMDTPESYGATSSSDSHDPTSRRSLRSTAHAVRAMLLLAQQSSGLLEGQDQQQRVMDTSSRAANQPTPVLSSLTSYSNVKKMQNEVAANLRKLQREVLGDDWDQKLVSTTGERIAKPIPGDDPPPKGLFNKYRKGLAIFYPPVPWV